MGCFSFPSGRFDFFKHHRCHIGTPTAVTASAAYTVTATNTGGSDTASLTITVNDVAPLIGYSPSSFTLTKGSAMSTATPTLYTTGQVDSWTVSPTLPAGLSLDASTGAISGIRQPSRLPHPTPSRRPTPVVVTLPLSPSWSTTLCR